MMLADFNKAAACSGVYRGLKDAALRKIWEGQFSKVHW